MTTPAQRKRDAVATRVAEAAWQDHLALRSDEAASTTTPQDATPRGPACVFPTGLGELPYYCETHGDIRDRLEDETCRSVRPIVTTPQDATEALARALDTVPVADAASYVSGSPVSDAMLTHVQAALAADGWSVVRTEDVERLRRVEAAARDALTDDSAHPWTHHWRCVRTVAVDALRAALGDPS